jgi:hypothetical protein
VTTRATSPFDDRTIRQVLGEEYSGKEDTALSYPDHKRPAHSPSKSRGCSGDVGSRSGTGVQWPHTEGCGGGPDDPLVRVLEAHARAQEVSV